MDSKSNIISQTESALMSVNLEVSDSNFLNESIAASHQSKSSSLDQNLMDSSVLASVSEQKEGDSGLSVIEVDMDRTLPVSIFMDELVEDESLFADPVIDGIRARVALVKHATIHCPRVNEILSNKEKCVATTICIEEKCFLAYLDSQASHSFVDVDVVAEHKWQTLPAVGEIVFADSAFKQPRIGTTMPLHVDFPYVKHSSKQKRNNLHAFEILRLSTEKHKCAVLVGRDLLDLYFVDEGRTALVLPLISSNDEMKDGVKFQCKSVDLSVDAALPSGVHEITENMLAELPSQAMVATPLALEEKYRSQREKLLSWAPLKRALEINQAITGFCNVPESVLKLKLKPDAKLRRQVQFPLPLEAVRLAQPTFERFRDGGRIERAPPGCPYNNPIVLPPKKDDDGKYTNVRFCFDGRHVNANLDYDDSHAIPDIRRAIADSFAECTIFGQFDLQDAYLQLLLHPDSRNLCAFMWKEPHANTMTQWRFAGCPFGLAPLTGHFQRFMSNAFSDLPFTFPYLDNIPFGSKTWEEHAQQALIIVERLNSMNLRIKPSSIMIGHASMRALGHVVGFGGISIDPDKLAAVATWEKPKTGKDMQRFLGFIGFISVHIRHYADLTARLQGIKSDDAKSLIEWTSELESEFNALKQAIMRAPTLAYPNTSKRFCIATDASNVGVGGVLYQPDDSEHTITPKNLITFTSHKLDETQRRYPAYKKELLAIVFCLRKFHSYIALRTDTVVLVDHKPLTYIMTATNLTPTLQQWLDVLQFYQFTPVYRPGVLHVLPDALSRMYERVYEHAPAWGVAQASQFTRVVGQPSESLHDDVPQLNTVSVKAVTRSGTRRLSQAVSQDAATTVQQPQLSVSQGADTAEVIGNYSSVSQGVDGKVTSVTSKDSSNMADSGLSLTSLFKGGGVHVENSMHSESTGLEQRDAINPQESKNSEPATKRNKSNLVAVKKSKTANKKSEQELHSDLLTKLMSETKGKTIPELAHRQQLVANAHAFGHFGRDAIYQKLYHDGFWWPKMRQDIDNELKACDACIRFVASKQGFHPLRSITSSAPWNHIQIDTSTNLPPSIDGHTVLLVIIDVFTGFVILRALKNKEAETVARELLSVFCLFGFPRILQSDNGTEFVNQVLSSLLSLTGVQQRLIAAYNPRADGKVERAVGSTLLIIKKLLHGHSESWSLYVDFAQLSFNLKIATLTSSSPFSLMFGRKANELRDYSAEQIKPIDLNDWKAHQEKIAALIFPAISDRITKAKSKMMKKFQKLRKSVIADPLSSGARVMLRDVNRQNKFEPLYVGPYTVERKMRNGNYLLRDATGDLLDRIVPIDQLKIISRTPIEDDGDDNIFQVNKIIDHRTHEGVKQYLIDWKGYDETQRTWEPETNILDQKAVTDYWKRIQSGS